MSKNIINWGLFILLAVVWGSSFILMKKSTEHLTGLQIGSIRIFSAGLVFLPFAVFHITKIPAKKLGLVILSGVFGNLLPAFLFAIAIEKSPESSLASILNSLTPLFVIVIGLVFFKKKPRNRKLAGVLIGFIGLLILSLSRGPMTLDNFGFTSLILIATVFYGININMVGHYLKDVDAIKIATVSMSFIAIPAGIVMWQQQVFSLLQYDQEALSSIATAVLLGIGGSAIATALFYVLIQKAGGLFASLVTYAIPVVAIVWGLLDHEYITAVQFGCLAVILGGVYLANRS
jgi:drug/metabolite transporter (DMT)-like permease